MPISTHPLPLPAPPCPPPPTEQKGQLGLGDTVNRNNPTPVKGLASKKVVGGSAGKSHSAVVTDGGESYTFGLNQYGQLGTGAVKKVKGGEDTVLTPVKVRGRRVPRGEAGVPVGVGALQHVGRQAGGRQAKRA